MKYNTKQNSKKNKHKTNFQTTLSQPSLLQYIHNNKARSHSLLPTYPPTTTMVAETPPLEERDSDLMRAAVDGVAADDERVLKVTVTKLNGKVGWTRDCDTLMIDAVEKDSAADRAGIKPKMRIISLNGAMVTNDEDYSREQAKIPSNIDHFTLVLDLEELLEDQATEVLDEAIIRRAQNLTLEEQVAEDQKIMVGIDLFMNNDYAAAEKLFEERAGVDPLAAEAHATIAFLRAAMSFSQKDMKEARRRIRRCISIATQVGTPLDAKGGVAGVASSIKGIFKQPKSISNCEARCQIIVIEANLLKSILLLSEDSVISHVRAGLGLRRGYVAAEALAKLIDSSLKKGEKKGVVDTTGHPKGLPKGAEIPKDGSKFGEWGESAFHYFDYNTVGGVQLNLGAINCALSSMPARVLALLSMFGYMCDREAGFSHLKTVLAGGGTRAAVGGLFLTIHFGVLPSFSSVLAKDALPEAEALVQTMLGQYPNSAIYLWVAGRVSRLKRHVTEAEGKFLKAIELGRKAEFPQLTHISYYEMAWCHCFDLNWEKAVPCFELLYEESEWSKSFNAYSIACCYVELKKSKEAKIWFTKAESNLGRKFGGRTISVEQYIERKIAFFKGGDFTSMHFPGVELMMLFNAFGQMGPAFLSMVKDNVANRRDAIREGKATAGSPDHVVALRLIEANCYKEVKEIETARKMYVDIEAECPTKKWKKILPQESWVLPYAYYEHGCLEFEAGNITLANELLSKSNSFKDFNFEMPLALRIHITKELMTRTAPKEKTEKKKSGGLLGMFKK